MATLDELSTALRNADAAGDTDAARTLAAEITKMRGAEQSKLTDVGKSIGSGLVSGAATFAGTGGDISKAAGAGINALGAAGVPVEQSRQTMLEAMPAWLRKYHEKPTTLSSLVTGQKPERPTIGSSEIKGAIDRWTGAPVTSYEPQTTEGKYLKSGAEFAGNPLSYLGPGSALAKGGMAVISGFGSEAGGQLAQTFKPSAEGPARFVGAVATPIVAALARRAVTPFPTSPERAAAANTLRAEGVTDITAGQVTGRKGLQYLEAERGAGTALGESAGEQFVGAALRRTGENATRATPDVVDRAFTRIGGEFDRIAANNTTRVDQQLGNGLSREIGDYYNLVSPPNRTPAVTNYAREIAEAAQRNNGILPGAVYQSLRSRMERAARSMGNNPEARTAIRGMRDELDDAMERSMVAAGNTADVAALQTARQQYRNLLAVAQASERSNLGVFTPAQLRQAVLATQGRRNFQRGQGDLSDLTHAGTAIMTPLPNSGTAGRMAAQNLGTGTSAMVGALLGGGAGSVAGPLGGGLGGAAGAMAGAMAPRLVGHAATSNLGRRYLSNQAMTGANAPDARRQALINALISATQ